MRWRKLLEAMRRRKFLVVVVGQAAVVAAGTTVLSGPAVVVAAGAIVFALWPEPPSRITRENLGRVRRRKLLAALSGLAVLGAAAMVSLWPSLLFGPDPRTPPDRLWWRIQRQWHRWFP
jgi:hypothetical protein